VDEDGPFEAESEGERLARNFSELLQELRVAQTGVQILFAFLLTLPFAARFGDVDGFDRVVYTIALLATAGATGMIIAPVAYHRMLFRRGQKPEVVRTAHRMAAGGLAFLVVAVAGAVLLVTDFLLGRAVGAILAGVTAAWLVLLWAVLPWIRRQQAEPLENGASASPR
jgi:hypothetical protein